MINFDNYSRITIHVNYSRMNHVLKIFLSIMKFVKF